MLLFAVFFFFFCDKSSSARFLCSFFLCYVVMSFFVGEQNRMDTQRELTKLKGAKKDKAAGLGGSNSGTSNHSGAGGGNAEETDMLEITLGMLRCSVCKDRFKSCAITR